MTLVHLNIILPKTVKYLSIDKRLQNLSLLFEIMRSKIEV